MWHGSQIAKGVKRLGRSLVIQRRRFFILRRSCLEIYDNGINKLHSCVILVSMIVLASCGDGHIQIRLKDKKDTPTPPDPFVFRIKT